MHVVDVLCQMSHGELGSIQIQKQSIIPVKILKPLSLLHVGVKWEWSLSQEVKDRSHPLETVDAVYKHYSTARVKEEEVVQVEILV